MECLWEDEQQCLEHIAQNPDYAGRDPEEAYKDFDERVEHIKSVYETITDGSFRWIKIIDSGRQVRRTLPLRTLVRPSFQLFVVILMFISICCIWKFCVGGTLPGLLLPMGREST